MYTDLELFVWIQKQFKKINHEYQRLGQFDKNRKASSSFHKLKSLLRIGNIASIDAANKVIKDPKKTNRTKLFEVVYTLLAVVDRDRDFSEIDAHHTTLMLSLLLQELTKYNIPPKLQQEIKKVLDKRYQNISLTDFFKDYPQLRQSLQEPPQQMLFSEVFDETAAKERLQKAKCLAMVSSIPENSVSENTVGVIMVTMVSPIFVDRNNKKGVIPKSAKEFLKFSSSLNDWGYRRQFEYRSLPYVLAQDAQGQLSWQPQSKDRKVPVGIPSGIISNEQLLQDPKVETALFDLLYHYPGFNVNSEHVALFPFNQGETKKRFKQYCDEPRPTSAEKLRQDEIEQTDRSLRRTLGARGSIASG